MSMSFEIFPTNNYIPNNDELICLSHKLLMDYLKSQNINIDIEVSNKTYSVQDDILNDCDELICDENKYELFIINNLGQASVFYHKVEDIDKEFWEDEIKSNLRARKLEDKINKSLNLSYSWSVKRTMGQPAVISIYYGFLAIAIAKLTDGILYSDDGAWEYQCFPATVADFEKKYLDLSRLNNTVIKEYINNCLADLKRI